MGPRGPTSRFASPPDTGTATASDEEPKPPRRKRGALRKVVVLVAILVVLLVVPWSVMVNFVAQSYSIPSEGMAPTMNPGDHIIVDKLAYRFSPPQPGDVIVFKGPTDWNVGYKSIRSHNTAVRWLQNTLSVLGSVPPDENQLVKRTIAVGGQTVECRAGTGITVDGKPVTEPYLDPHTMKADPLVYPAWAQNSAPSRCRRVDCG